MNADMDVHYAWRYKWIKAAVHQLGEPELIFSDQIPFPENMKAHQCRADLARGMVTIGYVKSVNPNSKDGRWKTRGKNLTMYVKKAGKSTP